MKNNLAAEEVFQMTSQFYSVVIVDLDDYFIGGQLTSKCNVGSLFLLYIFWRRIFSLGNLA